jgi:hypothetical protein
MTFEGVANRHTSMEMERRACVECGEADMHDVRRGTQRGTRAREITNKE